MQEKNYFEILGIEEMLNLDTKALQKRFYDLSRKVHPDFHQTSLEKDLSHDLSSALNNAFITLKDREKRLHYTVELYLGPMQQADRKNAPKELLIELMEMQEKLMEFKHHQSDALQTDIEDISRRLESKRNEFDAQLDGLMEKFDAETSREMRNKIVTDIREILLKKNYIRSLLVTIQNTLNPSEF
jgi:molecular chaperone HscB